MIDDKFMEKFIETIKDPCPKCGSTSIDRDWKEDEGNEVVVESICDACGHEWAKHYRLVEEYIRGEQPGS